MSDTTSAPSKSGIANALLQSTFAQWTVILTLIFGGCCSNALALEYTASHNPHAGSLITFTQFSLVALAGLRHRLYVAPFQPSSRDALVDEIARALLRERAIKVKSESNSGGGERGHGHSHVRVAIQGAGSEAGRLSGAVAERLRTLSPVSIVRPSQTGFTKTGKVDYEALKGGLLDPLMPGGSQKYVTRVYDSEGGLVNRPKALPTASRRSILLFDGLELVDGELGEYWDFMVVLDSDDGSAPREKHVLDNRPRMFIRDVESKRPRITWTNVDVPTPLLVKLFRLRFRPLKIPLSHWIVQVVLFLVTSLLNNAAFKYSIPMAVHIIFRSGGLVVNLLLGLALGKRYTRTQILSVLLVTAGVALSTMSSLSHKRPKRQPKDDFHITSMFNRDHMIGLTLLTLALVLSGLMGLAQERTYAKFGRHWQEGMFYLHFLALPMFALPGIGGDLVEQIKIANASPKVQLGHSLVAPVQNLATGPVFRPGGPLGMRPAGTFDWFLERVMAFPLFSITLPSFYIPLAINVVTQFLCVGGVHRLTSQVSSLTVTLVLVVRKAVSLWISVVLVGGNRGDAWLWGGAAAVVVGTVAYTLGQGKPKSPVPKSKGHKEL